MRKKLELREERDFGQKFNAVFTFVQSNFKPFIKIIGFTVGPMAIVGGVFFGLFFSNLYGKMALGGASALGGAAAVNSAGVAAEIFVAYFFLGLASLWMMIAVYSFMAEYDSGNEDITVEAVWKRGRGKILPTIGFGILTVLALIVIAMIMFALPGNTGWMVAFKMLLFYLFFGYIWIVLSMVVPHMVIAGAGLFESIGQSFILIRDKWWSTFGLLVVMGFVANIATLIFAVPFYIALIVPLLLHTGSSSILTVAGSCVLFLGSILVMTLPILAVGFQYFNLVERKDGTGLLRKIDQLGKPVHTANEGDF